MARKLMKEGEIIKTIIRIDIKAVQVFLKVYKVSVVILWANKELFNCYISNA